MIDFLVIGGGIAGISVAARLSNLGQVTVLEAESGLGYHASGRSAAVFEQTYGEPSTIVLNRASHAYHASANGGVLSPRGMMLIGSANDRTEFMSDLKTMAMEQISPQDAIAMVPILNPDVVVSVGLNRATSDLDTDRLMQNFARQVRANGGQVLTGQRVLKIVRTRHGWVVTTKAGDYSTKQLVNAAGAWVDEVATMAGIEPLGFVAKRRSMARIPAPGGHDVSAWPMMHGPANSWYAKPDAGKLLVSPSDSDPMPPHDAWPDDLVLAEGIARYEAVVTEPVRRLETSWAGLRTFSPDRSLVLGPDCQVASFIWVAGQAGCGFQTAPAASQLVADIVAGQSSALDAATVRALSPTRFV
jgi:glycine/D-amino acid oxidase-like deaminating enzyme